MGCINTKNLNKKIVYPSEVLQKKVKSENNVEVKDDMDEGWALEKKGGNIAELSDGKEIDQVNMIKEKGLEDLVRRYECDSTASEFDMLMKFLDKNGDGQYTIKYNPVKGEGGSIGEMQKKKVDQDYSRSNEPNPPLGQEHQFETPQPSKSSTMTFMRKKKRGNDLTPIDYTPTPRGDKHLGINNRGIHNNEKKMKNKLEIKLREQPVDEYEVELEGVEHNDQEEFGVETNREGNENEIVEEETNNDEDEE
ncbi:uncharacterized protein LOC113360645 [Papaver somniferum]|uniref:uncharacterized protein LOC113360645 n=1 Tax=Papaver somniferum TaxID=3469 RepID=UPI000E7053BC|nr:uncharacterized protein LOC113360645 [Papaver somniferum]